jgi:hypothetical protein
MPSYYDDNYGWYDIQDQDDVDFYFRTQRESVEKVCRGCGSTVRIRPDYAYCTNCADRIEGGQDL